MTCSAYLLAITPKSLSLTMRATSFVYLATFVLRYNLTIGRVFSAEFTTSLQTYYNTILYIRARVTANTDI